MSICLALAAAAALSTSTPAVQATAAPTNPHVVQYVQVQYRNVLKQSTLAGPSIPQILGATLRSQVRSFLTNVLRSALSHANPILGAIANTIANRVTAKLTNVPINIHPKPNIQVVAEFEATTTIAPARSRTDIGPLSTIIQCDKQQIIVLDNEAKLYSTRSFTDALNDADAGPGFGPFAGGSPDISQQIVVPQPDDGTETIAGLVSHHALITSPLTSGFGSAKTDIWFADMPMPDACATMPQQPGLANVLPQTAAASSTIRIPLRSVQWSEMDFSGAPAAAPPSPAAASPSPSTSPPPSPTASARPLSYRDPVLDTPGISWIETTSVTTMSYDASYFDVPSGYAQSTPEPSPSPT
jgi:hypothetical protein